MDAKNQQLLKKMIHKVSVRASEFQSHSKQAADIISTPEEDSANIVKDVSEEIEDENSSGVSGNDAEWGEW